MTTLGFIGIGDLAEYTIKGFRAGGYKGRILLSPRNQQRSQMLAQESQCEVLETNQAVADTSDFVVISARPCIGLDIISQLELRSDQQLISVMAGIGIEKLAAAAKTGLTITRAMPVSSAEVGSSTTITYPFNHHVLQLFNHCGTAIAVETESVFEQGSVLACVYTWYFELFEQLIRSITSKDFPPELATKLVLGMASGAACLAQQNESQTPGEIAEDIANEGTFSKLGLDLLKDRKAFSPWQEACQLLLGKISTNKY